jgi:hypothetical protein
MQTAKRTSSSTTLSVWPPSLKKWWIIDGDGIPDINDAELAAKVKKLEDPNNF